jgi:hypothetical protein
MIFNDIFYLNTSVLGPLSTAIFRSAVYVYIYAETEKKKLINLLKSVLFV